MSLGVIRGRYMKASLMTYGFLFKVYMMIIREWIIASFYKIKFKSNLGVI